MDVILNNLLILTLFFPAVAALVIYVLPDDAKDAIRRLALLFSLVPLILVLVMWFNYDRVDAGMQYQTLLPWFPSIGSSFHIGVDGISLAMLLLTAILTPLSILASFDIEDNVRTYMALFLLMETAMMGLFVALDLIIFFIFWEFSLVPMYFLIKLWGGKDREYASFKFFIYTMAGSLGQQEQLRRNMVNDVAHELRTPLTNLRGYLEAARDGLVGTDAALVDSLYDETMLLSRLVADLQELAQAEAGRLTLMREAVALPGVVEQAVGMLRPQAEAKGVTLTTDLAADLPPVDADRARVGQVLRNLLQNAFAHTPEGGSISVTAHAQAQSVQVAVHDTGSGIAPEHLPFVFDRFYRADRLHPSQTGRAGLGLAIVKQLVLAHGGEVTAASEPGRGSTFTFTLPRAQAV